MTTPNTTKRDPSAFTKVAHDPTDTRHHGSINIPVYQSSLFAFETYDQFEAATSDLLGNHVYSRGNNPTVRALELKLAELEEGEDARCFASGMAAITTAIMSCVGQGDHVLCVNQVYGPTREFLGTYLKRFGVETTFVDGADPGAWRAALQSNTKLFYLESPTTMLFELQDIRACADMAHAAGATVVIDNTWATPVYQKPLQLGADLVVHSLTKYVSGHSDCVGGVIVGAKPLIGRLSVDEFMLFGGIMAPQIAALMMRGLRTLPLRMQRHESSGLAVAEHMAKQPYVAKLNHPGLPGHPQQELFRRQMSGSGSLFSFETTEPIARMKAWANKLTYFKIGVSWGGFESLVTVNRLGRDGSGRVIVRMYVGQESPYDLIRDIDDAWQEASRDAQAEPEASS